MTSSMEIGGPMACLYLLENPDHYTSHRFRVFYWKPYVAHVKHFFTGTEGDNDIKRDNEEVIEVDGKVEDEEKIMIMKSKSNLVGYSSKLDYIYRPKMYENVCLYDWMRLHDKIYKPASKKTYEGTEQTVESSDDELEGYENDDLDQTEQSNTLNDSTDASADPFHSQVQELQDVPDLQEEQLSDDEMDLLQNEAALPQDDVERYKFLEDHPQQHSHIVKLLNENEGYVPNFVSPIPRSDRGDREYYCATIMTLFKPWREPTHLKSADVSWDHAFDSTNFTDRQLQLMRKFNIRYECHDAKDDYRLHRNKNKGKKQ